MQRGRRKYRPGRLLKAHNSAATAVAPMVETRIYVFAEEEQKKKAHFPMDVTESGMTIEVREEQSSKA